MPTRTDEMVKPTKEEVELAERYESTLRGIEKLRLRQSAPNEEEVERAETYLHTLKEIEKHHPTWTDADAEKASDHLGTLKEIEKRS